MARNYSSVHHSALSSDTLAAANDTTQAIFWRILCASDDWGRFPYNPGKLQRLMQDFTHTQEQIVEAVDHFIHHGSIIKYEIGDQVICQWLRWDAFQNMKWKNDADWPNQNGEYESSTNPLSQSRRKERIGTYRNISEHIGGLVASQVVTKDATNVQDVRKEGGKKSGDKPPRPPPSQKALEIISELFPDAIAKQALAQAHTLDDIQRLDNQPLDDLLPILQWARTDDFWKTNFQSCASLRKRRNGTGDVMKWQKIRAAYKSEKQASDPGANWA